MVMEDFVARPSPGRIGLLIVGSVVFVVIGLWMVGAFGPPPASYRYSSAKIFLVGWAGIIFFGLTTVLWTIRLFDNREELRIGAAGICYSRWSKQMIPWAEVSNVTVWGHRRQKFIILHLRNPALLPGRGVLGFGSKANRALTGGDISISLIGTDRNIALALSAIARYRPRTGTSVCDPPSGESVADAR